MTCQPSTSGGRFSIVTPCFNMARYLPETIESILANLKAGDEYFIVDGGSTDGSVEIIRSYEERITGWISEPDRGYADALHKGFAGCSNPLLAWINTGDTLLTGALDCARNSLERTGADFIFGDDLYIDPHGQVIFCSNGHMPSLRNAMLYGSWTPLQDACFWRRDLYELVGGIDASLMYAADYDLFLRFSLTGTCRYVPVVFSCFRQHESQKSIAGAADYKLEREQCRRKALAGGNGASPATKLYYWLYTRCKARVTSRLPRKHLSGVPYRDIPAESYPGIVQRFGKGQGAVHV